MFSGLRGVRLYGCVLFKHCSLAAFGLWCLCFGGDLLLVLSSVDLCFVGVVVCMHRPHDICTLRNLYFAGVGNLYFGGAALYMRRPRDSRTLYFGGVVPCTCLLHDIHTLRNLYSVGDSVRNLCFAEDTLICTLLSVRWLYFDEDTLIRTLLSVRWLYFVGDTQICTLFAMRCSRESFWALDESKLMQVGEGTC